MKYFLLLALTVPALVGAAPRELSSRWILETIHARGIRSIEGLLGRFTPASLERHLLAYGSESQQYADFLNPRVIVYSPDADFLMAFNGKPGSKGYDELEILEFDHATWKFKPSLVHFDPKGIAAPELDDHPTECARCHQTDIRPNWDPYFHWVGFYGAEDDNVLVPELTPLARGPEVEKYREFLAKQRSEVAAGAGRYRFLPKHPTLRRNEEFNHRITALNMRRFLRIISEQKLAGRILPHLDAGVVKIDELPKELLRNAKRSYAEVRGDTARVIREARFRRLARQQELTGAGPQGRARELLEPEYGSPAFQSDLELAASWRFVFEEIFGIPFRPIPTSRHLDYRLNLIARSSFSGLTNDTEVDWAGRVILPMGKR